MTQNYNGITVDWTENEWSRLQDVRNERVEKDERVRNAAIRGLKYILEEDRPVSLKDLEHNIEPGRRKNTYFIKNHVILFLLEEGFVTRDIIKTKAGRWLPFYSITEDGRLEA